MFTFATIIISYVFTTIKNKLNGTLKTKVIHFNAELSDKEFVDIMTNFVGNFMDRTSDGVRVIDARYGQNRDMDEITENYRDTHPWLKIRLDKEIENWFNKNYNNVISSSKAARV